MFYPQTILWCVEATEAHVAEALRLFHVATLDASQSGMVDSAVLTDEQRREVQVRQARPFTRVNAS